MTRFKEPGGMSAVDWEQLSLTCRAFKWAASGYIGSSLPGAYDMGGESPSAVISMDGEPLVTGFVVEGRSGSYQVLIRNLADIPSQELKGDAGA